MADATPQFCDECGQLIIHCRTRYYDEESEQVKVHSGSFCGCPIETDGDEKGQEPK